MAGAFDSVVVPGPCLAYLLQHALRLQHEFDALLIGQVHDLQSREQSDYQENKTTEHKEAVVACAFILPAQLAFYDSDGEVSARELQAAWDAVPEVCKAGHQLLGWAPLKRAPDTASGGGRDPGKPDSISDRDRTVCGGLLSTPLGADNDSASSTSSLACLCLQLACSAGSNHHPIQQYEVNAWQASPAPADARTVMLRPCRLSIRNVPSLGTAHHQQTFHGVPMGGTPGMEGLPRFDGAFHAQGTAILHMSDLVLDDAARALQANLAAAEETDRVEALLAQLEAQLAARGAGGGGGAINVRHAGAAEWRGDPAVSQLESQPRAPQLLQQVAARLQETGEGSEISRPSTAVCAPPSQPQPPEHLLWQQQQRDAAQVQRGAKPRGCPAGDGRRVSLQTALVGHGGAGQVSKSYAQRAAGGQWASFVRPPPVQAPMAVASGTQSVYPASTAWAHSQEAAHAASLYGPPHYPAPAVTQAGLGEPTPQLWDRQ